MVSGFVGDETPDNELSQVRSNCMETIQNATSVENIVSTLNPYADYDIILSLLECIDRLPVPIKSIKLESFRSAVLFVLRERDLFEPDITINSEGITEIELLALHDRESRSAPNDDGRQISYRGILVIKFYTSGYIEYHTLMASSVSPRLLDADGERLDVNGIALQDNVMDKIRPFLAYQSISAHAQ